MIAAVLRVPAPIPPLPTPTLPLGRLPPTSMASSLRSDAVTGAKNQDAPPPQPPEKPLPGDCCGSGCVRCVWDVYHEELEAYQKAISQSPPDNKDTAINKATDDANA